MIPSSIKTEVGRTALIVCCSFLLTHSNHAQVNLVVNPSFEEISSCPTNHSQLFLATGWGTLMNGGGGTLDLFHECCSPQRCGAPTNWINSQSFPGYQHPRSGTGYAGLIATMNSAIGGETREYMQSELMHNLIAGKRYCVKMYVSLAEFSEYSCISLGIYLDNGSVQSVNAQIPSPPLSPQVVNTTQQLDDTLNWVRIEGSFIANGTEEYITIGNFFPNSQSGIVHSYPSPWTLTFKGSHYYIDDVSVIDISTPASAGNDTIIHPGDSVFIGREPEIGLSEACIWYVNGLPTDTIAGMWVAPYETTTYVLEQTLCSYVSYDTVTVLVDTSTGFLGHHGPPSNLTLYPNPSTGEVWFKIGNSTDYPTNVEVYALDGTLIHNEIPKGDRIGLNFSSGTYFVIVRTEKESYRGRVVIIK